MTSYERLAELAADELGLVRERRIEELAAVQAEAAAIAAALPSTPPAEARPALLRAAAANSQMVAELAAARTSAAAELGRLRRGRGAVRAYGHVTFAPSARTADREA